MKLWAKNNTLSGALCNRYRVEEEPISYVKKVFDKFEVQRTWLFCFKDHKPYLIKGCDSFEKYENYFFNEDVSGIRFKIKYKGEELEINVLNDIPEVLITTDNPTILEEIVDYIK